MPRDPIYGRPSCRVEVQPPISHTFSDDAWSGPMDLTTSLGIPSSGYLASSPSVTFTPDRGQQLVFWQGADGDLWEGWCTLATSTWSSQDLSRGLLRGLGAGTPAATPSVIITPERASGASSGKRRQGTWPRPGTRVQGAPPWIGKLDIPLFSIGGALMFALSTRGRW